MISLSSAVPAPALTEPVDEGLPPNEGRATRPRSRRRPAARLHHVLFAAPSIVLVVVFFVVPFLANVVFAFTRWTGFSDTITWSGLDNFKLLADLGVLTHAIKVTVVYALVSMVVQNAISLTLAVVLADTNRINTVFRSVFFIPVLISPLAAGYIWAAVLDPSGPFNAFLSAVLPGQVHYSWLGHSTSALVTVASIDAWKWSGLVTLVYIAGLNRCPRHVIEAATIDGAGPWRRLWTIRFPLLAPAFTFNVVLTLVGAFSALDVVFSTTNGGPGDATSVLNVAVYNQYAQGYFGSASALGLVITLMVIFTAVPLIGWLRRREVQM
ncbi:carbohydrate ABC transporter permease [Streptomyces sp. MBT62]|uniref:carbohydrate ABC transporter permease n=1 Tax=Streptomyces sp. MBT62 TaxID=2800410 RepID=UPI00190B1D8D|nr:sugar ABC transporter permease [Streptomyces sp. MBT62]MBK3565215.1 sugar ABC transporter permease [Streptomyces sp. MBT62]